MGLKIYAVFTLLIIALFASNSAAIVNNRVTRVFDMNGPNTKQVTSIEFTNDGEEEISQYILLVLTHHLKDLVHIEAKVRDDILEAIRYPDGDVRIFILSKFSRHVPLIELSNWIFNRYAA